jgi:hypothetical protein
MTLSIRLAGLLCCAASMATAQPTAPRRTLVREMRIDATREDFATFGRVTGGPRQQIAVYFRADQQVRIYDSAGRRAAAFGRQGAGPGEFRGVQGIGWVGDTVWVLDLALQRMVFFASSGRYLRVVPLASIPTRGFLPVAVFADGSILGTVPRMGRAPGVTSLIARTEYCIVTPARPEPRCIAQGPMDTLSTVAIGDDKGHFFVDVPFASAPFRAITSSGTRFGFLTVTPTSPTGGTMSVTVLRRSGERVFSRSYPFVGVPIPAAAFRYAANNIGGPGDPSVRPPQVNESLRRIAESRMPRFFPPVEHFTVGMDSGAWITLAETKDGVVAVHLDDRGAPVASVLLPPRSRILQASSTQLWLGERDADDLESIVRYRLGPVTR